MTLNKAFPLLAEKMGLLVPLRMTMRDRSVCEGMNVGALTLPHFLQMCGQLAVYWLSSSWANPSSLGTVG